MSIFNGLDLGLATSYLCGLSAPDGDKSTFGRPLFPAPHLAIPCILLAVLVISIRQVT